MKILKVGGIPVAIKVNPLLSLLAALFISLVAGWLLSLGEPGKFLAEEVLFPLGLFYLKLLFLFSIPLLSGALICRGEDLSKEWRCCRFSGRLHMFWGASVLGAVLLGLLSGGYFSFAEPMFTLKTQYLADFVLLRKFLPAIVILSFLFGVSPAGTREEEKTFSPVTASLFQALERTGRLLLKLMPAGVILLLAPWISFTGYAVIGLGLKLLLILVALCAVYSFLFYGYSLRRCGKNCPAHFWSFFKSVALAGIAGFSLANCTNSAISNLQRLGIDMAGKRDLFTSGMHGGAAGTALYCGLTGLAVLQYSGVGLSWEHIAAVSFFSVLFSVGAADFTGGGLYRLLFLVLLLDVPISGLFPVLAVECFLDGVRRGVNVLGAGTGIYLADKLRWDKKK